MSVARYKPQGNIKRIFENQSREVLVQGPARTGKSLGLLEKCYLAACKYPNSRSLLIRKTRASMSESVLQLLEDDVIPRGAPWRSGARRSMRDQYRLPNGSIIVPIGMDHTDKVMSSEWDRIYVFETTELVQDDYLKLISRLSGKNTPFRQIQCDCNPTFPAHWLNQRATTGLMDRIATTHKDNPRWWDEAAGAWTKEGDEYVHGTLGRLTGHMRERLLLGRWAAAEGLVYPEFEPSVHVIDAMPEGWEQWRKVRAIDFGYTNPFVCQWWAIDGDGRAYLYREIYRQGRTMREHSEDINRLSAGESYDYTVSDHDAGDRATLGENGIDSVPANKEVSMGIQAVAERLHIAPDGRPRLYFLRSALVERDETLAERSAPTSTVAEFDSYIWAQLKDGKPTKEEPVKGNDHGMDAMRYMCKAEESSKSQLLFVVSGEQRNRFSDYDWRRA